ncbi:hypothetical protein SAMN06265795_12311 [Noviherbaspirillum humi]|uniref:TonB C-terminal domain-containing protein n=2 Tax=Noviherbaspirillum humi TaxID=1688639 RepID=A0A239LGR3_9BURK|nr:hypothetical protein SAMN06265795_12311 [Noviherbaspirillum humi]
MLPVTVPAQPIVGARFAILAYPRRDAISVQPTGSSSPNTGLLHAGDLIEPARILHEAMPDPYSVADLPAGRMRLALLINEAGKVEAVRFEEELLPMEAVSVLRQTFEKFLFQPAKRNGAPIKSEFKLELSIDSTTPSLCAAAGNENHCPTPALSSSPFAFGEARNRTNALPGSDSAATAE